MHQHFDYYKEYLEKGIAWPDSRYVAKGKRIEDREYIGLNCFTSERLIVTYPGSSNVTKYKGYGHSPEYLGFGTGNWFNFYVDLRFEMGNDENGPVVEHGHCTKIEPSK